MYTIPPPGLIKLPHILVFLDRLVNHYLNLQVKIAILLLMNINDINLLTNWNWWIQDKPPPNASWLWFALAVSLSGIVVAFIIQKFFNPSSETIKKLKNSWVRIFSYCAFSSLMVLFGRWQQLPILGMRLFHGIIVAIFVLLGLRLLILRATKINKIVKRESIENKLNKYLPKPKK